MTVRLRNRPSVLLLALFAAASCLFQMFGASRFVRSFRLAVHSVFSAAPEIQAAARREVRGFLARWVEVGEYRRRAIEWETEKKELQAALRELEQLRQENAYLRRVLEYRGRLRRQASPAWIVARHPQQPLEAATLDRGRKDGVEPGQIAVAYRDGRAVLVGRVEEASEERSILRLVTSPSLPVWVRIRSGPDGVGRGAGDGRILLDWLDARVSISEGEEVLTTGSGDSIPPGLLVGRISRVRATPLGPFSRAWIEPAASPLSLEEVFLLK